MRPISLAAAFAVAMTSQAMALSATDFALRTPAGTLQAQTALVPRLDGQEAALGSRDVLLLCFAQGDGHALVLKVSDSFYTLNGTARELAGSAQMLWKNRPVALVDPYASRIEAANYMQRMIGPGNAACRSR